MPPGIYYDKYCVLIMEKPDVYTLGCNNYSIYSSISAWIVVIVLAVLLVIVLLINIVMFVTYKRNRPGYRLEKLSSGNA